MVKFLDPTVLGQLRTGTGAAQADIAALEIPKEAIRLDVAVEYGKEILGLMDVQAGQLMLRNIQREWTTQREPRSGNVCAGSKH